MTISIIADQREAHSNIANMLREMPDVEVEIRELDCGDYVLKKDEFVVERKAGGDFVASIIDGRFIEQAVKMKAEYDRVVYIIEGNPFNTRSSISPEAIRGALSFLIVIQEASVIYSEHAGATAAMLATLARQAQHGLGYEVPLRSGKPKDPRVQQQFVVEGFPGIGPSSAKILLSHFGSVKNICAADEKSLLAIPGIGPKTAKQIMAIVSADYRQFT